MKLLILGVIAIVMLGVASGAGRMCDSQGYRQWRDAAREARETAREARRQAREAEREAMREVREARREALRARRDWGYTY